MAKVAALTMAYKSYRFLEKWVQYYGGLFGEENLYVVSHGGDPIHDDIAGNCNLITVPRQFTENMEIDRWNALGDYTGMLSTFYDYVICGDCDELILTDPRIGMDLSAYMAKRDVSQTVPVGLYILPPADTGARSVDWEKPLLGQASYAIIDGAYCKPSICSKRRVFTSGGHEAVGEALDIDRNLMLCHLKYLDDDRMKLAQDLVTEVRATKRKHAAEGRDATDWSMSTVWQYGKQAEEKLLNRMLAAPLIEKPDTTLFAYRLLMQCQTKASDGTTSYRAPMRNPRRIQLPERFFGSL